ncbi:MAG: DNA topoisomerase IV subunit A [Betaproteobacteria bacterium]|nr:DNA topoisomerase IV subunit A [Betaproteobacteria bacterium]
MTHPEDPYTLDIFAIPAPETPPPPPPAAPAPADDDDSLPLGDYAERCYLAYAMSVVKGRALPNVEDGMKPVQRRILYSMREMGLGSATRHVKSARVVGDVIGKLHPHGDQSVYDAMVRMAQTFTLRYPLIDGQGNFGSRDGDGAAAMRYTESRLTPVAELLLAELDQGTVAFRDNYDGAFREPVLLPARLPMLLANGASGIAVGMATEIPPHNLRELGAAAIALLKKPDTGLDALMLHVPGPDFPGGGQVISPAADLRALYEGGRGSLRVRARWSVEPLARGQWRVVIHELPPGVSTAQVLTQIDALANPQPKAGRKDLTPEQKAMKQAVLAQLEAARDESDEKAPVRLVLEPCSRNLEADAFMRLFLAQTSLETNVAANLTVIGHDGRPGQKGLVALLSEWTAFRVDTVRRRSAHRLDVVNRRIHILEGRRAVLLNLDAVIRVIREADEPKADLMQAFGLSEIQAEDILEIRLRQLARLEAIKIEQELAGLLQERDGLSRILADGEALTSLVIDEIRADMKKYGDPRRTLIETAQAITVSSTSEETVVDEPVTIIVSKNGWVRARNGHGIDPAGIQYKAGDGEMAVIETRSVWPLVLLDSGGRTYTLRIPDLPSGRGDGAPLTSLVDLAKGARVLYALSAAPDTRLLVATDVGYGFLCRLTDLVSRQRAGKAFLTVEAGYAPLPPVTVQGDQIAAAASNGRYLVFPLAEMKEGGGGKGVQIMKLEAGETLTALTVFGGQRLAVTGLGKGRKPAALTLSGAALEALRARRAKKGQLLDKAVVASGLAGVL